MSRKLFKYRENRTTDYRKAKESIITGVGPYNQSWCDKPGVTESLFYDWIHAAISNWWKN